MVASGHFNCKWLDIHSLAGLIKNSSHVLGSVKYFTSRVSNNPGKQKRQNAYIEALETTPISIIFGQFRSEPIKCTICGNTWYESKEKMTDVNIATEMIMDAYRDTFDAAILISGDSDLVPPVKAIRKYFPAKEIIVAFPPSRESNDLKKIANSSFILGRQKLENCQLPEKLFNKYGYELSRPIEWS
jgi:uncharacterized LabA/DUF88 family protein